MTSGSSSVGHDEYVSPHSCAQCNTIIFPGEPVELHIDLDHDWKSPLDSMRFRTETYRRLNLSLADLRRKAIAGCGFAMHLSSRITKIVDKDLDLEAVELFANLHFRYCYLLTYVSLDILYDKDSLSKAGLSGKRYTRLNSNSTVETCIFSTGKDPRIDGFPIEGPMAVDPLSKTTIKSIQTWLNHCNEEREASHLVCSLSEEQFTPSRLLKIIPSGAQFKLQVVDGHSTSHSKYAALSYCWGGPQPQQLTTSNLETYKTSTSWESFPLTLLDAAKTTYLLGLQYLWVDSLCIIQDGDYGSDKTKEISSMTKVYTHATFTIMARRGSSVNHGFLHPRTPTFGTTRVQYRSKDGHHSWVTLTFQSVFKAAVKTNTALDTRGWAMQEYLLSRRLISFGPWSTEWSCRTGRETHRDGKHYKFLESDALNQHFHGPWITGLVAASSSSVRSVDNSNVTDAIMFFSANPDYRHYRLLSTDRVYSAWLKLVRRYSHRLFSVPTDRAVAISGLAERFGPSVSVGKRYIAGLWESKMPGELLWYNWRATESERPATYRGPSWSWVSIDDSVLHFPYQKAFCKVLDIGYELVEPEALFGAVSSALLKIEGPSMSVEWQYEVSSEVTSGKDTLRLRWSQGEIWDQSVNVYDRFYIYLDTQEPPTDWTELVLIAIGSHSLGSTDGLALVYDECGHDRLRRIGLFTFRWNSKKLPPVEDWPTKILSIV